jgi:hypothetical protein
MHLRELGYEQLQEISAKTMVRTGSSGPGSADHGGQILGADAVKRFRFVGRRKSTNHP